MSTWKVASLTPFSGSIFQGSGEGCEAAAESFAAAYSAGNQYGMIWTLSGSCSAGGGVGTFTLVCSGGGCAGVGFGGATNTYGAIDTGGSGGGSGASHTLSDAEYIALTTLAAQAEVRSPFDLSIENATTIALSIAACWAIAFAFRSLIKFIDKSDPTSERE